MNELEKRLEEIGIVVECWSPLEIREEETNSFATGNFATLVIEELCPKQMD